MNRDIADILEATAAHYGVGVAEILAARHDKGVLDRARASVMTLARRLTSLSFPKIGTELHRDHSTIQQMVKRADYRLAKDPALRRHMASIASAVERSRERLRYGEALERAGRQILAGVDIATVRATFEASNASPTPSARFDAPMSSSFAEVA